MQFQFEFSRQNLQNPSVFFVSPSCHSPFFFCLSLSLALKGLGLFSPMGLITTEGFSVSATDSVEDWIGKELTDEGEIDEKPSEDDPELNLLARLNRLELARNPGLELLPNDGVGWGAELAGGICGALVEMRADLLEFVGACGFKNWQNTLSDWPIAMLIKRNFHSNIIG